MGEANKAGDPFMKSNENTILAGLALATIAVLGFACTRQVTETTSVTPETAPSWAYPVNPPASDTKALPDTSLKHVPGSQIAFYLKDLGNRNRAPDWHPEDHTPMPDVVLLGDGKDVSACGYCHLPTGAG